MGAGREAGGLREKVEVLQGDPGLFSIHDSRGNGFFLYVNDLNSRPQPDLCGCAEIRRSGCAEIGSADRDSRPQCSFLALIGTSKRALHRATAVWVRFLSKGSPFVLLNCKFHG